MSTWEKYALPLRIPITFFHNRSMQITFNRYVFMGLTAGLITAATAMLGVPGGFEEFTVPIWNILLQFNLCSAFVFLIVGVLQSSEIALPDLSAPLQLFTTALFTFVAACLAGNIGLSVPIAIKLFLFTLSTACIAAAWALIAVSALKQLDSQG